MASITQFWVFVEILNVLHKVVAQDAALGVNTRIKETEKTMPLQSNSFIDLISKGIFVDKSPLLGFLLRDLDKRPLGITVPRGWGKTTNLDMLRIFLEIPIHPNGTRILPVNVTPIYRLFKEGEYRCGKYDVKLEKPLLISDHKYESIFDAHFGQYPILEFSFPDTPWTNETDLLSILRQTVAKTCDQHKYMLRVFDDIIRNPNISDRNKDRAKLDRNSFIYLTNTGVNKWNSYDLRFCILELFKILKRYYKKKVIVLVDNYDRSLGWDDEPARNFLNGILRKNRYLETAILFGTLPLTLHSLSYCDYTSANTTYHYFPISTRYQRFFGFTTKEMNLIYDFYEIPIDQREKMRYWYAGYKYNIYPVEEEFQPSHSAEALISLKVRFEEIFNPLSVRNYLVSRQLRPYWIEANSDDVYLDKVLCSPLYEFKLNPILNGNPLILKAKFPLGGWELWHLDEAFNTATHKFLSGAGYLTFNKTIENPDSLTYNFKIPNYEIAAHLQRAYAVALYNKLVNTSLYDKFTTAFLTWERFLLSDDLQSPELENVTQEFAVPLFKRLEKIEMNYIRSKSRKALFDTITISIASSKIFHFVGWQFGNLPIETINETAILSDMILSSETRGIVIYVQNAQNASLIIHQPPQCTGVLKEYATFHRWKDIKIVDCRAHHKKRIEISSVVCSTNMKE